MTFHRYAAAASIFAAWFLGASCPTKDAPPPPRLSAPSIGTIEITGVFSSGRIREAVGVHWTLPMTDSVPVSSQRILFRTMHDSDFSVLVRQIPDTIRGYFAPFPDLFLRGDDYTTLYFAVNAYDTLGREGDTSGICSLTVLTQPILVEPGDTLRSRRFQWLVGGSHGIITGYYTHLYLWHGSSIVWQSPRPPAPFYGGYGLDTTHTVILPDSVRLESGHTYWWGAKVEANDWMVRESIKIRPFTVP